MSDCVITLIEQLADEAKEILELNEAEDAEFVIVLRTPGVDLEVASNVDSARQRALIGYAKELLREKQPRVVNRRVKV